MAYARAVFVGPVALEPAELVYKIAGRATSDSGQIGPGLGLFGEVGASLLFAVLETDLHLFHIAKMGEPGMQRGGAALRLDASRLDLGRRQARLDIGDLQRHGVRPAAV